MDESTHHAWLARSAVVVGLLAGALGLLLSTLALLTVVLGPELLDAPLKLWLGVGIAGIASMVCAFAAVYASGRASVRPRASLRIQLAAGLLTLPVAWGMLLLVSNVTARRAARAGDESPRGERLPATALALATVGCIAVATDCIVRLLGVIFEEEVGAPPSLLPYLGVALAAVAGACEIWRRPRLAVLLLLSAGALWFWLGEPWWLEYLSTPLLAAGMVTVLVAVRRVAAPSRDSTYPQPTG